jgi:O-antigen/teichoic acid export membrane protein
MSETPPGGLPTSVERQAPQADTNGALRVVTILVMIGSILGLLGSGLCFLAFLSDGFYGDMAGILLLVLPLLLFFVGAIWVCKALLDRLKR